MMNFDWKAVRTNSFKNPQLWSILAFLNFRYSCSVFTVLCKPFIKKKIDIGNQQLVGSVI